ncbi:MAG: GAF domain-containing protein [Methylovulum sp.]|uniref:GAF domain-containing protein n=1 Tax=Methylovulum sp. TaxID=1916980 RepID=UPI002617EBCE|nr:GAF domain-containing protein [Methylovulum sp.]MDD2723620.1 GAF domain-containing protein [Methylovulum sp.]MDD5124315.1 GAF domain-containing protein [Methylovulum sp.]
MKTFIKATEIWIPDKQRTQLEFGSGLYGALTEFKAASEQQHFAYDEGLPGKAWAQGHPVMLTEFEHSYFKRTAAAKQAGLTCGIAIPIFSGDFLLAVVMFLCGDDEDHAGAIEVWSNHHEADKLSVMDGYYGTLQDFEQLSRQTAMSKGEGIPGQVWASGMPVLIEDIGQPETFVRGVEAQKAGITTCLGIPVAHHKQQTYMMTFLSAKATPLAKRIQIWMPDAQGQHLVCQQGYSKKNNELAQIFETITVKKGEGALGRVWLTGMPIITGDHDAEYNPELDNLSTMLAIPVIEQGRLQAIVTFLF